MNTLLHSLLKENKRILQSLHACIGLDFIKPYYIFDIAGKFTINQLIKAAAGAGYTPKKDIFVIFTRTETGFYTNYRVAALDSCAYITGRKYKIICPARIYSSRCNDKN